MEMYQSENMQQRHKRERDRHEKRVGEKRKASNKILKTCRSSAKLTEK